MTEKTIIKTCELLYAAHYLPIAVFSGKGRLKKTLCSYPGYDKVFSGIYEKIKGNEPVELIYGHAGLYGAIKSKRAVVLIGPFLNKRLTEELLSALIASYGIAPEEKEELRQFLLSLPREPMNRFLNFIGLVQYLINGEEISVIDQLRRSESGIIQNVGEKQTVRMLQESSALHGTYNFEQQLLALVSAGDEAGLNALFDAVARLYNFNEGKLADDTLRQSKNIFIGLICMVGKVGAIGGNLDIEHSYQLIDLYTQECEKCMSISEVNELRYTAIMDFTRRVAQQKHPDVYSGEVYNALQYIKGHTNNPLSAADVVDYIGKSRSSFMPLFKAQTGYTIGEYITKAKLDESKMLLSYSNLSLSEISSFLYFSSQSHFQNQFKKAFGITPLQYRRQRRR